MPSHPATTIVTSLNLSDTSADMLRRAGANLGILLHRYFRAMSRHEARRLAAKSYNRPGRQYQKVSIRLPLDLYNQLRRYSHVFRISASRIVDFVLRAFKTDVQERHGLPQRGSYYYYLYKIPGDVHMMTEAWATAPPPKIHLKELTF